MTSATDPRLAQAFAAIAAARGRGDAADELRLIDEALRLAPDHPQLLNARGMRALQANDMARARDLFTRAIAADPREPALWMNLATAARALGDDAGEADALNGALDIDRRHFMAQLRLAELNERRGRMAAAAQGWSAVVQLALGMDGKRPGLDEIVARGRAFLARHNDGLAEALDTDLGETIAAMGGSARRFSACMDHLLGRRPIYTNECHGVHYPFLPADEYFDRALFPWFAALEAKTDAIRAEALALLEGGGDAIRPYVRQEKGTPENKWSALDQSLDWSACFLWEYGERNDAVCALCPETAAALEAVPQNRIPGKAPSAFFSVLASGAHIPPHTGVTNTRAIIHLPLVVPDKCRFRVGGETRAWREGEAFAFDDTIEHEAWNDSDQRRIVLILDVWNPHLTADEQELLRRFFAISGARV